jgi:branched-chain amino acid transport system ATP-binding protein
MGAQVRDSSAVPCLTLRGLSKHFGGLQAVKDITMEIHPGDRMGILGPNGAGKTTLFHLITGVLPPTSGRILLFGHDVTRWPPYRRTALGMARTFQITTLFPKLTVLDSVLLAVQGRRRMKFVMWRSLLSYPDVYGKARALLEGIGFWDRRQMEIRHLSHGEQRQLEIVLALASEPQLLLLDEPAAGLSTGESQEMAGFLRRLDPRLAIVMIEHDMDVAFAVADSITVLHYGEIVEAGSLDQIRNSPRVHDIYLGTR